MKTSRLVVGCLVAGLLVATIFLVTGFGRAGDERSDALGKLIPKLKPLHKPLPKPSPNDWLARHDEPGQTLHQYLRADPVTLTKDRNTIYVQPLGPLTKQEREIVELSAEYLGLYFNCAVKIRDELSLDLIPQGKRRVHFGDEQILTTYVLNDVLKSRLPDNAAAYIAFTATDLWPGKGWNFVYGQASLRNRVGVWSLARNGDPTESDAAYQLCLLRTLKTATHETGHMFSIKHCIAHECNMCGRNHRDESDRSPLYLCPICMAKICWATNADPIERYRKLQEFSEENGLEAEAGFFAKSIQAISTP